MATLEEKILGEKRHNYCSSSEESDGEDSDSENKQNVKEAPASPPEANKWEGSSTNTGPKGVIKDWQRYKQLENEKRSDDEKERIELMKKLTLSVQSALDEEKEKAALDDPDLVDLLNDEFLLNYQKQRMVELLKENHHNLTFGDVIYLTSDREYLDAVDKEDKNVTVIMHLYEESVPACKAMNECLEELCKVYRDVKFCTMVSSRAGLSRDFSRNGVPALIVYKAGQVVGNFVQLTNDLGNDFCAEDVQGFLVEHGMLEDKSCTPLLIKTGDTQCSDSD